MKRLLFPAIISILLVGCGRIEDPNDVPEPPAPAPVETLLEDNISVPLTDIFPELLTHPRIEASPYYWGEYLFHTDRKLIWEHQFDYDPTQAWIPAWNAERKAAFSRCNDTETDELQFESVGEAQLRFPNVHLPDGTTACYSASATGSARIHLSYNEDFPLDRITLIYFEVQTSFGLAYEINSPEFSVSDGSGGNVVSLPEVIGNLELTRSGLDIDVNILGFTPIDDPEGGLRLENKDGRLDFVSELKYVFLVRIDQDNLPAGMKPEDLPPLTLSAGFDVSKVEFPEMNVGMDVSGIPASVTRTGELEDWPAFLTAEGASLCFTQPYVRFNFSPSFQFYMSWDFEAFTDCGRTKKRLFVNEYYEQDRGGDITDTDPYDQYGFDQLFRTPFPKEVGFTCTPTVAENFFWHQGQELKMSFSAEWFLPLTFSGHFAGTPVRMAPIHLSGRTLHAGAGRDHKLYMDVLNELPFSCEVVPEISYDGGDPVQLLDRRFVLDSFKNQTLEFFLHPEKEDWTADVTVVVKPLEAQVPFGVGHELRLREITFTANFRSLNP